MMVVPEVRHVRLPQQQQQHKGLISSLSVSLRAPSDILQRRH